MGAHFVAGGQSRINQKMSYQTLLHITVQMRLHLRPGFIAAANEQRVEMFTAEHYL